MTYFPPQSGPCVICGDTNYGLSCGGPTICPKCDCGNFDAATVQTQARTIAMLKGRLEQAERDRDDYKDQMIRAQLALYDSRKLPFLGALSTTLTTMKTAHGKGGDRLMSVWEDDIQAVEAALSALSPAHREGKS